MFQTPNMNISILQILDISTFMKETRSFMKLTTNKLRHYLRTNMSDSFVVIDVYPIVLS